MHFIYTYYYSVSSLSHYQWIPSFEQVFTLLSSHGLLPTFRRWMSSPNPVRELLVAPQQSCHYCTRGHISPGRLILTPLIHRKGKAEKSLVSWNTEYTEVALYIWFVTVSPFTWPIFIFLTPIETQSFYPIQITNVTISLHRLDHIAVKVSTTVLSFMCTFHAVQQRFVTNNSLRSETSLGCISLSDSYTSWLEKTSFGGLPTRMIEHFYSDFFDQAKSNDYIKLRAGQGSEILACTWKG